VLIALGALGYAGRAITYFTALSLAQQVWPRSFSISIRRLSRSSRPCFCASA
jgi:hypothetical protein